jgi:hypothetical protein
LRKQDQAAENRARVVLLENGWQLCAGHNPAVIVAENGERTLYGSRFAEIGGRAIRPEKPRFPDKTREGRAQRAVSSDGPCK